MAVKRKKKSGGGANWQDTYGDMVTLLLCFFVLLYSISTVDVVKWENLVRSMNPNVDKVSQVVQDEDIEPGEETVPGSIQSDKEFEQLYEGLAEELAKATESGEVSIHKGEDYQFITFKDSVFFDGDSSELREEGKLVLDAFIKITKPKAGVIEAIHVMGHTTQANPDAPVDLQKDRLLSAARSANVVIYLQSNDLMDPAKLVHEGYGQFHPIASFNTEADREKNRRAEILILQKGATQKTLEEYYKEVYGSEESDTADKANADSADDDDKDKTEEKNKDKKSNK